METGRPYLLDSNCQIDLRPTAEVLAAASNSLACTPDI
jgi:hypothetical protein